MASIGRILNYNPPAERRIPSQVLATWENGIFLKKEDINRDIKGLRSPQIGAIYATLSHWEVSSDAATIVMPTGTGKTEVMLSLLIAASCYKTMIIVPTDALRSQISNKVASLGLLADPQFSIVKETVLKPIVGVMSHRPASSEEAIAFMEQCNVVVTTISIIGNLTKSIQMAIANQCSHLFVDEAHHTPANSWSDVKDSFKHSKILQFTATPFRNDDKPIGGKIIFNYPLRKAQKEGYFKPINYLPIIEWDPTQSDKIIAEKAIQQLNLDIRNGHDHILMARVNSIARAEVIQKIYATLAPGYNPLSIHSQLSAKSKSEIKAKIIAGECKIVVCVDMLGEGFDMPRLKIAAFHDIKKSLPTTLQLIGRFTRTSMDNSLGDASIIVNIADVDAQKEIEHLYASDADWNQLLPYLSEGQIDNQISLREFIQGFEKFPEELPIQNLLPALSAVVYKINEQEWHPEKYEKGLAAIERYEKVYFDTNTQGTTIVIVAGKKEKVAFGRIEDLFEMHWTLYIIYRNVQQKLLFINCSDNGSLFENLAKAITDESASIIDATSIFRCMGRMHRTRVTNVGLKDTLSTLRSFTMHAGSDIEKALTEAQQKNKIKSNIFVTGYENGEETSVGCSYRGRVWSRRISNISEFTKWCDSIGSKILDPSINDEIVMRHATKYISVDSIPRKRAISIEWPENIIGEVEKNIFIGTRNEDMRPLIYVDIDLSNDQSEGALKFLVRCSDFEAHYTYKIIDGHVTIENTQTPLYIKMGRRMTLLSDFFCKDSYYPTIRFVDGTTLQGQYLAEYSNDDTLFNKEDIQVWNWDGVNIKNESQGNEKDNTSIQYHVIQKLKSQDFDIIFDDDNAGEIADVIAIKVDDINKVVKVELFHLKFSQEDHPGARINDLYAVNGQAQKCVSWLHSRPEHIIGRMLRRGTTKAKNRYELGTENQLSIIKEKVRSVYNTEYIIHIVQPGLSKAAASTDQLKLLSITEAFLWETRMIKLQVIASA